MSIPTSGLAALLVVATFALASCGSDDETATATATTVVTATPTATQTTTQQSTAKAPSTAPKTTTTQTQTATAPSTTTQAKTQTTTSSPAPKAKETSVCDRVGVGARPGDVAETLARITQKNNVTCAGAAYIASQWGAQQIGADKALLPVGWKCTSGNVCRDGNKSVAFVLERPQE